MASVLAFALLAAALLPVPTGCSGDGDGAAGGGGAVPPASATIGPAGGEVTSADGTVTLVFPADALATEHTVTLATRSPENGNGDLVRVGHIADIELEPKAHLQVPVTLTFNDVGDEGQPVRVARFRPLVGQLQGDAAPAGRWVPLGITSFDAAGHATTQLYGFSSYCSVKGPEPSACAPSAQALTPPPAPPGYTYLGTEVVTNGVYDPSASTYPLSRPDSPDDILHVSSETVVSSGASTCDVVVVHHFVPTAEADKDCPVPPEWLIPPPTPPGYRYLGYGVVVNFVMQDYSIPLDRDLQDTDISYIRSETVVIDSSTQCDIIVSHTFAVLPPAQASGQVGPTGGTIASDDGTIQMAFPGGSVSGTAQVDVELVPLDLQSVALPPAADITVVPFLPSPVMPAPVITMTNGTLHPAVGDPTIAQLVLPLGDATTVDGSPVSSYKYLRPLDHARPASGGGVSVVVGDLGGTTTQPVYVPVHAGSAGCTPPPEALAEPPAPPGYRYMGREVVIDFVYQEGLSTVPLDRGTAPTDIVKISSSTVALDGVVVCDIIVAHVFEPDPNDQQCIVPPDMMTPPPAPPGYSYVGYDVVINAALVDTTIPLTRPQSPTDSNSVSSSTKVGAFGEVCDIIVRHLFEPTGA